MKAKLLLLPMLIATAVNADVLAPTEDSANYADKRVRYTAKLQEAPKPDNPALARNAAGDNKFQIPVPNSEASAFDEDGNPVVKAEQAKRRTTADLPLRELNEAIQVSFRDRSLPSSIRTLTPPGWVLDLQIDKSIENTLVSFSGDTSYAQALKDILEPQGLTYLAYRNMKPKPLIVVTHGGK